MIFLIRYTVTWQATQRNKHINRGEEEGSGQCRRYSLTQTYPVAGAVLGSCLGAPVGLVAGVNFGILASISGTVFGK